MLLFTYAYPRRARVAAVALPLLSPIPGFIRESPPTSPGGSRSEVSSFTLLTMRAVSLCAALGLLALSAVASAEAPIMRHVTRAELPAAIKPAGALVDAVAWNDASGHNVAAFWLKLDEKKGTARLQVVLWSGTPGTKGVLLRTIKDAVNRCELDLVAEYLPAALGLTDLDADGYGELTFAYKTTCTGDVSPLTLKLLMLERRDKYIVRGTTVVDVGNGEKVGGEKQAEPGLKGVPSFLKHAESVWTKLASL